MAAALWSTKLYYAIPAVAEWSKATAKGYCKAARKVAQRALATAQKGNLLAAAGLGSSDAHTGTQAAVGGWPQRACWAGWRARRSRP